jgi:hypothetical protein
MNVNAISTTTSLQHQRPQGPPPPPKLQGTAQLLGMTADELQNAQKSGAKLTDLAAQKGVSKDDLVKSIAADMKAGKPEGAPELSDAQLTEMATNIAEGKRPQGPPPGHGVRHADRAQDNLSSLANELGVSVGDLLEQVDSGANLRSVLSGSGYGSSGASARGGLLVDQYA